MKKQITRLFLYIGCVQCVLVPRGRSRLPNRREVLVGGGSAVFFAVPLAANSRQLLPWMTPPPEPVEREGLVFVPQEGDVSVVSATEIEKKYGPEFCEYLSRVLLRYDQASAKWWSAQARKSKNADELAGRLDAFVDSTKLSLSRRFEYSKETPQSLLSSLNASPEFNTSLVATRQLAAAFALMPQKYQPLSQLDALMQLTENRSVLTAELNPKVAASAVFAAAPDDDKEQATNQSSPILGLATIIEALKDNTEDLEVFIDPPAFSNKPPARGRLRLVPALAATLTNENDIENNDTFYPGKPPQPRYRAVDIIIDSGGSGYSSAQSPVLVRLADGQVIGSCTLSDPVLNQARPRAAVYLRQEQNNDDAENVEVLVDRTSLVLSIVDGSLKRDKNGWSFPAAKDLLSSIELVSDSESTKRHTFTPVEVDTMPTTSQFLEIALCGGICASASHALLTPVELAKTKLQLAGNDQTAATKALGDAYKKEGTAAFFAGIDAVTIGFFLSGAVGFGGTAYLKTILLSGGTSKFFQEDATAALVNPDLAVILAALLASVAATIVVAPFEVARVKAMAHDTSKSQAPAMLASWQESISENDGNLRNALFGTLDALLLKDIVFAIVKFGAFDKVSDFLYETYPELQASLASSLAVSLAAGTLAGVGAALASQPLDAAFTRIEASEDNSSSDQGGVLNALVAVYKDKGVLDGLYAGAAARALFAGTLIALEFVFFEFLKKQLHVAVSDFTFTLDVLSGATAVLPPPSPLS